MIKLNWQIMHYEMNYQKTSLAARNKMKMAENKQKKTLNLILNILAIFFRPFLLSSNTV